MGNRRKEETTLLIRPMSSEFEGYLCDESRTQGHAEGIALPKSEDELCEVLRLCSQKGLPVTAQGGRTGLAGGASPQGGVIVNLSRMNRLLGLRRDGERLLLRVQPGVLLSQVRKALQTKSFDLRGWDEGGIETLRDVKAGEWFFSPDPTEPTATLGGMAACNASGARSLLYGATRVHIHGLRVVLADGRVAALQRGRDFAQGRRFALPLVDGGTLEGTLPAFDTPPIKDAGFFLREDMELVDLFIGSQGTLGIISELEVELTRAPKLLWGVTAFLPSNAAALRYVRALKGREPGLIPPMRPAAIEFFDRRALSLVEAQKAETPAFAQLQELPKDYECAVYCEFNTMEETTFLPTLRAVGDLVAAVGGDRERTWVARDARELEKLLFFRHSVPETIDLIVAKNQKTEPCIIILSTDMAVDDAHFETLFSIYEHDLAQSGLPCLIFGHIGENHVHPNILARTRAEYEQGHALFEKWACDVSAMGGSITAEHGAGKIKRKLEAIMLGQEKLRQLWTLKRTLDPQGLLGPGNVLVEVDA